MSLNIHNIPITVQHLISSFSEHVNWLCVYVYLQCDRRVRGKPQIIKIKLPKQDGTGPVFMYCSLPWAIAASLLFSSGLSCNIVWMTGKSACLSLPDCRKINCSRTFFRYSKLATLFSRSWFRSRRRSSLFNSYQNKHLQVCNRNNLPVFSSIG